jgi:hypothetical protein
MSIEDIHDHLDKETLKTDSHGITQANVDKSLGPSKL